uniref:T-cell activation inhibitor, mitochondrial n=2 Tax=Parascaris univalens TaxID=6257 RepID=A0A915AHV1_PARUN
MCSVVSSKRILLATSSVVEVFRKKTLCQNEMLFRFHWRSISSSLYGGVGNMRYISSQQAAVALRPFYFAVHPDRFANNPEIRAHNERSLQTFNGYLNDLFRPQRPPDPVKVDFYIVDKNNGRLRKVQISLTGSNARSIIVAALEKCNLPTKNVPMASTEALRTGLPRSVFDSSEIDAAKEMIGLFRKKRSAHFVRGNDLSAALRKHREAAKQAAKAFEKTSRLLQEEVDELEERAGITEIIWLTNWAKSHMRRSLLTVNRLITYAPSSSSSNSIVDALRGYCLRFGNGSFVCCDGGMQFGVQDVPEVWERVCSEAFVRRSQLPELRGARARLSELMGNAHILAPPERSLAQTVDQIQSLIVRILTRDDSDRLRLQTLGKDTLIEVVSAYDELALGKDGRLFLPCNAGIKHVISFLSEKAHLSRQINASLHRLQCDVENVRRDCIGELKLRDLTWQQGINLGELLSSLRRLQQVEASLRELLVGMWLHFDTNPTIYVMVDGRLSVPLEWV